MGERAAGQLSRTAGRIAGTARAHLELGEEGLGVVVVDVGFADDARELVVEVGRALAAHVCGQVEVF